MLSQKAKFVFSLLFLLIVSIDQLLKHKVRLMGGFYVCNQGISFGFDFPMLTFLLIIAIFGLFWLILYVIKLKEINIIYYCGLILIISGAFSNLIDRLTLGCVVDYFSFLGRFFPVFNLADLTISLGSVLILLKLLTNRE